MQDKYILGSVAIAGIAAMETAAIVTHVDGAYLSICVGAISAIVGAIIGVTINLNKIKEE